MSASKTYKLNLRGIDVTTFRRNPVVLENWDYEGSPIGRAVILPGKTAVEVEYLNEAPTWRHTIGTSIMTSNDGVRHLMALAPILVLEQAP